MQISIFCHHHGQTYKPQSVLAHKDPIILNTSYEQGWKVDPIELDRVFLENKERNKLLILINPDNPTGVAYTPEENKTIAEVCRKHQALVLSDEIYSLLNYDDAHDSLFKVQYNIVFIQSLNLSQEKDLVRFHQQET